jgi:hypothetical protein
MWSPKQINLLPTLGFVCEKSLLIVSPPFTKAISQQLKDESCPVAYHLVCEI